MANTYLSKTLSTPTDGKKWTWSAWVKRSKIGGDQALFNAGGSGSPNVTIRFGYSSDDKIYVFYIAGGSMVWEFATNAEFRDTNGWYHIVVRYDSTQSSATDRLRLYVNGTQQTFSNSTNSSQNITPTMNSAVTHYIGNNNGSNYFDGSMSHVHFCDGYSYASTEFGETDSTTGIWKIKTSPSVSYGNNGFFILKDGNSVTDQSGQSNNWTVGRGTLTDLKDNPSNVFATLNPLLTHAAHGYSLTYGLGNNKITFNEPSTWTYSTSTIAGINGKFYAEFKIDAVGSESSIGVIASDTVNTNQTSGGLDDYLGKETDSIGYLNDGRTFKNNSAQQTGLTAISAGNILGVALDTENNTCQFYINGSSSGNPVSLTADKFYHFGVSGYNGTQISCNFGNGYFGTTAVSSAGTNASGIGIFEYDVPTGYTALCTKGLNE